MLRARPGTERLSMAAAGESRGLILAAVALALFAGAMFWALQGPAEDEPVPAAAASADEPAPTGAPPTAAQPAQPAANAAPAQPAVPPQPAVDLFAGEMPDFMATLHARVLDKKPLGAPQQRELYEYGKKNPNDARPQLLLAWDSMNREWD